MPVREERLKLRLAIRKEQLVPKDIVMTKLRDKITKGYLPTTPKELADLLKMVHEYGKSVGQLEECQEILEKLVEGTPMTMEKLGVECKGDHKPTNAYMEKKASGEVTCRHCGAKFADLHIAERVSMKEEVKQGKKDAQDSIEKMLNID
jgi:hypothetical protein